MAQGEERPELKACVFYGDAESSLVVERGSDTYRIEIEQGEPLLFNALCAMLDGQTSLAEIAAHTDTPLADVVSSVGRLRRYGLIVDGPDPVSVEPADFIRRFGESCAMWRRHMLAHRLFHELFAESATHRLLEALLIETWFYVQFAERAIRIAADRARGLPFEPVVRHLAEEEKGHDALLLDCLGKIGAPVSARSNMQPGIATESVGLFLADIASRDPLAFLALLPISEPARDEIQPGLSFIAQLEERYRLDEGALDGLREHLTGDDAGGHSALFGAAVQMCGNLPPERADFLVNTAHRFKHYMDAMNDGLLQSGSRAIGPRPGAFIPFRQV